MGRGPRGFLCMLGSARQFLRECPWASTGVACVLAPECGVCLREFGMFRLQQGFDVFRAYVLFLLLTLFLSVRCSQCSSERNCPSH